jgi:hypothetical protein
MFRGSSSLIKQMEGSEEQGERREMEAVDISFLKAQALGKRLMN